MKTDIKRRRRRDALILTKISFIVKKKRTELISWNIKFKKGSKVPTRAHGHGTWGSMFIVLFVQNIDLEEIWLRKTNYFLLFHRVNSSHAKILPSYLYLLIFYSRLVVLASKKLPLYFGSLTHNHSIGVLKFTAPVPAPDPLAFQM